jgi:putative Holliday junction resolvase
MLLTKETLQHKSILALDWGEKFIGLATFKYGSDPYPLLYGRIAGGEFAFVWNQLQKIIHQEAIDILVCGVPYMLDNRPGSTTKKINLFLEQLKQTTTLPLFEVDETLSTFAAEERMKQSPRWNFKVHLPDIDALSACIILEDFIAQVHRTHSPSSH